MKHRIDKLVLSILSAAEASGLIYYYGDIPVTQTAGFFTWAAVFVFNLGAFGFLLEFLTGKEIK